MTKVSGFGRTVMLGLVIDLLAACRGDPPRSPGDGAAAPGSDASGPTDVSRADGPANDTPLVVDAPVGGTPDGCSPCTAVGNSCCPGTGGAGLRCHQLSRTCIRCGGKDQACCSRRDCNQGLVCTGPDIEGNGEGMMCQACGAPGQLCCDGQRCDGGGCCLANTCVAEGETCLFSGLSLGTCRQAVCTGCGRVNEPCCPPGAGPTERRCTSPDTRCGGQHCLPCGGPGEWCCFDNTCAGNGCCVPVELRFTCVSQGASCIVAGTTCTGAGSCGACGGLGQPCCQGSRLFCSERNTRCESLDGAGVTHRCVHCGGPGMRECFGAI